ncbi:hypothetical protein EMPG_10129 [Blastomyces silverae]|uniref:Roadblock/LAMTOR2 domain-containing protein n=1 Tax=Blastomyces silverae TaxID=2060906 RepID=A0A0H1B5V5_9EURO|nr:hypothetical protein EMPG_10129 [Blastomyces silverae]
MAAPPQLPRQFSAHLSNLTSRPGVQSTLILSRKDGSIIRTTGLLATRSNPSPTRQAPAPAPAPTPASISDPIPPAASPTPDQQATHPDPTNTSIEDGGAKTAQQQAQEQQPPAAPYEPSQAETLAAHIFAFVSSASALSTSLSKPPPSSTTTANGGSSGGSSNETDYGGSGMTSGAAATISNGHARNDSADSEGHEREEDDELKLLRLRTKIHEIIIIPDRKFLLCVVHDLSGATGGTAAGGGGKGGGFSR